MAFQILLQFEHEHRMAIEAAEFAKLQAKLALREQRRREAAARKIRAALRREQAKRRKAEREAKTNEWRRRTHAARLEKIDDLHAQCGIRWFACSPRDRRTGNFWRTCPECGQPLNYTSDPNAQPQVCKGRKLSTQQ